MTWSGRNSGAGGRHAGDRRLAHHQVVDPVGVVRGHRVGDQESRVAADDGKPLVTERVHRRDHVVGQRGGVVAVLGLVGQPDPALVDRHHLEVPRQGGHQQAPRVPRLRPAVHEQQRRAVASDNRVQAHVAGVDVAAGERVGEPRREVRRPRHGARALWGGQGIRC